MEGGPFSRRGPRLAPRTFVLNACSRFKDGGLPVFKAWFSLSAAHIRLERHQPSQGWRAIPFSTCGPRISGVHI
eukprot:106196-Pyramimonas_sp.AAC.1